MVKKTKQITKANIVKPVKLSKFEKKYQDNLKNAPTVGQMISQLQAFDSKSKLYFSGLDFYRIKNRGSMVQVEFGQNVYINRRGRILVDENK